MDHAQTTKLKRFCFFWKNLSNFVFEIFKRRLFLVCSGPLNVGYQRGADNHEDRQHIGLYFVWMMIVYLLWQSVEVVTIPSSD